VTGQITPADLQALATRADQLAEKVATAKQALRELSAPVGYRLDDVAGGLRRAAEDIRRTAEDLDCVRARDAMRHSCSAQWGACPEHGNTLVSSGGRSWCRAAGCGRSWSWDRGGLPCTEPADFPVRDAQGKEMLLCPGHTLAARQQLVGAKVEAIEGSEGGGGHA
jgi:hypothetical protein